MFSHLHQTSTSQKVSKRRKPGRPIGAKDKTPRNKREANKDYPDTFTLSISRSMALSLLRMCPPGGPTKQSVYLRTLIHNALLHDDPVFRQEWAAKTNGGAPNAP
jgi:hypothetical protein